MATGAGIETGRVRPSVATAHGRVWGHTFLPSRLLMASCSSRQHGDRGEAGARGTGAAPGQRKLWSEGFHGGSLVPSCNASVPVRLCIPQTPTSEVKTPTSAPDGEQGPSPHRGTSVPETLVDFGQSPFGPLLPPLPMLVLQTHQQRAQETPGPTLSPNQSRTPAPVSTLLPQPCRSSGSPK